MIFFTENNPPLAKNEDGNGWDQVQHLSFHKKCVFNAAFYFGGKGLRIDNSRSYFATK